MANLLAEAPVTKESSAPKTDVKEWSAHRKWIVRLGWPALFLTLGGAAGVGTGQVDAHGSGSRLSVAQAKLDHDNDKLQNDQAALDIYVSGLSMNCQNLIVSMLPHGSRYSFTLAEDQTTLNESSFCPQRESAFANVLLSRTIQAEGVAALDQEQLVEFIGQQPESQSQTGIERDALLGAFAGAVLGGAVANRRLHHAV